MYEAARRFAINVSCIAVHHRNGPPRRCRASANSVGRFSSRWMYSQSGSARATRDDGWGGKIAASSAASSIPSESGHEHPCRPPASRMRRPCRGRCPVPRRSSGGCAQARTPGAPLLERSAWTTSSEPSPSSFPRPTSARMEERAATEGFPAPLLAHYRVDGMRRNPQVHASGVPWKGAPSLRVRNPPSNSSLQLVVTRAVHGGNDMD